MSEGDLKKYIKWSLRVLADFKITLAEPELKEFKGLKTIEAIDRRRVQIIKNSFDK